MLKKVSDGLIWGNCHNIHKRVLNGKRYPCKIINELLSLQNVSVI